MDLDPETDLILTREINAPRELLFMCWTTPEHLMCFIPAINTPSPLPARTGDGVGYSAKHLVA